VRPDWRDFTPRDSWAGAAFALYDCKYRPDQARVPAGSRQGGQWTDDEGGSGETGDGGGADNDVEDGDGGGDSADGGSGDNEILASARPIQYDPSKPGWHHYQAGPNVVSSSSLNVSREEMADQLARYSVPGRDPARPVEDGKDYPVYDPETGLYAGRVETTVSADGLTITNRTRPGHIFHDGIIVRRAQQAEDGSWTVTTVGEGNNVIRGMNIVNQEAGPGIFNGLDRRMRDNIERHHAKGIVTAARLVVGRGRGGAFQFGIGGAEYVAS
jgi:hypothetical protein